ncbi:hypothetical protein D9M72_518330 [compost metagenome]
MAELVGHHRIRVRPRVGHQDTPAGGSAGPASAKISALTVNHHVVSGHENHQAGVGCFDPTKFLGDSLQDVVEVPVRACAGLEPFDNVNNRQGQPPAGHSVPVIAGGADRILGGVHINGVRLGGSLIRGLDCDKRYLNVAGTGEPFRGERPGRDPRRQ